jgi:hypothetical protein
MVAAITILSLLFATSGVASATGGGAIGTITGQVLIVYAPTGWSPYGVYVLLCPNAEHFTLDCKGQLQASANQSTGVFSVSVPAATWNMGMYYYTANGQMILSKAESVTARSGKTTTKDIVMDYVVPAVEGKVAVTGAPKNFDSIAYMGVQACPSKGTFSIGCKDGQEAYEDVGPGTKYLIDLAPGAWNVAAYYRADNNSKTFSGSPVKFTALKGITKTVNVTIAYQGI